MGSQKKDDLLSQGYTVFRVQDYVPGDNVVLDSAAKNIPAEFDVIGSSREEYAGGKKLVGHITLENNIFMVSSVICSLRSKIKDDHRWLAAFLFPKRKMLWYSLCKSCTLLNSLVTAVGIARTSSSKHRAYKVSHMVTDHMFVSLSLRLFLPLHKSIE